MNPAKKIFRKIKKAIWPNLRGDLRQGIGRLLILRKNSRLMPDFFIPGAMRSGTTSLYFWLASHPEILRPLEKEVYFWNQQRLTHWSHYHANYIAKLRHPGKMAPDANPQCLCSPFSLHRICQFITPAKFICILRNPLERARSSYWHAIQKGWFQGSFSQALAQEKKLFPTLESAIHREWRASYPAFLEHAHVWQSVYAWQLKAVPPGAQKLVLFLDDLLQTPAEGWKRVCDFLGICPTAAPPFPRRNEGLSQEVCFDPSTVEIFRKDAADLQAMGLKVPWLKQIIKLLAGLELFLAVL